MAEWTNIFDLGEWDVYVRFKGVTGAPSQNSWVLAADLDPGIGTVEVVEGLIVCNFEDVSGSGSGMAPSIIVMPRTPLSAPVRLTCSGVASLPSDSSYFEPMIAQMIDGGDGTFDAEYSQTSNYVEYASSAEWTSPAEAPSPLESGCGMNFLNMPPGI